MTILVDHLNRCQLFNFNIVTFLPSQNEKWSDDVKKTIVSILGKSKIFFNVDNVNFPYSYFLSESYVFTNTITNKYIPSDMNVSFLKLSIEMMDEYKFNRTYRNPSKVYGNYSLILIKHKYDILSLEPNQFIVT